MGLTKVKSLFWQHRKSRWRERQLAVTFWRRHPDHLVACRVSKSRLARSAWLNGGSRESSGTHMSLPYTLSPLFLPSLGNPRQLSEEDIFLCKAMFWSVDSRSTYLTLNPRRWQRFPLMAETIDFRSFCFHSPWENKYSDEQWIVNYFLKYKLDRFPFSCSHPLTLGFFRSLTGEGADEESRKYVNHYSLYFLQIYDAVNSP